MLFNLALSLIENNLRKTYWNIFKCFTYFWLTLQEYHIFSYKIMLGVILSTVIAVFAKCFPWHERHYKIKPEISVTCPQVNFHNIIIKAGFWANKVCLLMFKERTFGNQLVCVACGFSNDEALQHSWVTLGMLSTVGRAV